MTTTTLLNRTFSDREDALEAIKNELKMLSLIANKNEMEIKKEKDLQNLYFEIKCF